MRTLASTFSTRDEAEAASRRLEAIGIGRDRIVLKDVAPAADGPAGAGAPAGVFISVKVTTDQVQPVSEILKSRPEPDAALPPEPTGPVRDPVRLAPEDHGLPPRPLPPRDEMRGGADRVPPRADKARQAADQGRRAKYLIYYGLALVVAFMIGAWAGLLR